ncbi:hypothetical protein JOB18_030162 [Solea senegalensis]|nr:vegetative cell wall protein gp1-like [Solea senegalensis]KAG7465588.1 hypothetical protein JOB18_030162 [Solea senegalensis]
MCCKKDNMDNYTSKRKVHSAPGKLNPMFNEPSVKERPQISQPTFMESTATQVCSPLIVSVSPSRPAPQPPHVSSMSSTSQAAPAKPQPPAKPLPPLTKPKYKGAKPNPPPVPPVKPSPPPPLPPAKPQVHRLT